MDPVQPRVIGRVLENFINRKIDPSRVQAVKDTMKVAAEVLSQQGFSSKITYHDTGVPELISSPNSIGEPLTICSSTQEGDGYVIVTLPLDKKDKVKEVEQVLRNNGFSEDRNQLMLNGVATSVGHEWDPNNPPGFGAIIDD